MRLKCIEREYGIVNTEYGSRNAPTAVHSDFRIPYSVFFNCVFRARVRSMAFMLTIVLCGFAVTHACNVPVFRFALERWRPDPYRVTVFHRGPLADAERALIDPLEGQQDKSLVNLVVRTIDLDKQDDAADRELFASLADPQIPAIVVQYPAHLRIDAPIWSGKLSSESVDSLIDSPIRKELVRRLADGQTAVWLFLESGLSEKDDAAAMLVQEQLKKLEQELKLPELTDASEDKLLAATPLQVAFSLMRVPRGDAEQPLVKMLLHSESDLLDRTDPMVFPVFGRGRALLPLIGAGVTAENIHGSAAFLVGACSCEVKEMNPGFDLLLAADWNALLSQDGVPLLATETRHTSPDGEAELVPIPSGSSNAGGPVASPPVAVRSRGWLVMCVAIGGLMVVLGLLVRR